jgi:hypothetical protein
MPAARCPLPSCPQPGDHVQDLHALTCGEKWKNDVGWCCSLLGRRRGKSRGARSPTELPVRPVTWTQATACSSQAEPGPPRLASPRPALLPPRRGAPAIIHLLAASPRPSAASRVSRVGGGGASTPPQSCLPDHIHINQDPDLIWWRHPHPSASRGAGGRQRRMAQLPLTSSPDGRPHPARGTCWEGGRLGHVPDGRS